MPIILHLDPVTDVIANVSDSFFITLFYLYTYVSYVSFYFRYCRPCGFTSYDLLLSLQHVVYSTFVLARDSFQLNLYGHWSLSIKLCLHCSQKLLCRVRLYTTHCSTHVITWIFGLLYSVVVIHNGWSFFDIFTWVLDIYTLFFNKNKLNKNIEAEIARKIRTI